eukprot:TRINITY_DN965_c0_g1_i1.p1 TRINITY_DN965_c0_g1~~TRINITY_DN965_c0_g1_i1.p1  ORF type:complete len:960 (+),score=342.73 TRINITY_DN965_c0_g1_i1:143-3022(+)
MAEDLSLGDRKAVQTLMEQRKEEASFIGWTIKKDAKNRSQKRLIVLTGNKLFSLKPGGKIAREGHWLELSTIQSPTPKEANFTFKNFKLNITTDAVDEILTIIRNAYSQSFPGIQEKDRLKLDINPPSRITEIKSSDQPLGGFITTYKSLCNFYNVEARGDIIWDLENLFIPGHIKEFALNELEQPISANDLKPLLGALQYNTYFKGLTARDFTMDKNMIQSVADMLKSNTTLDELDFSRSGINKDGIALLSEALSVNKSMQLTSINLSYNNIEDKGASSLATYIGGLSRGIAKVDISNCGIMKAGLTAIAGALKKNAHMSSTLTYFDISNNKLEAEGSSALAAFLANTNSIRYLFLGNTMANTEVIIGAIQRGCGELSQLDVSGNKFAKSANLPKYLQGTAHLNNLNLSNTQGPESTYKEIVSAFAGNVYLKDCVLNISENKLGPAGARSLASIADKLHNIVSFDVGDNEFGDEGITVLADALCHNSSIKHLSLAGNFRGKPGKARPHAIDSIANLINSECPIESLNLSAPKGAELKNDLIPFLYALATNESLKSLDISGNQIGNKGAVALGKAIQTNESLETLKWDNNLTTLAGFQGFNNGLRRNHTLKNMPMPINDISTGLRGGEAQGISEIVNQMERHIMRNQSPGAKFQTGGTDITSVSSQFAFLSSGQREAVQKTLMKIKSTGRKVADDHKILIEDAENQDNVMTSLFSTKDQFCDTFDVELKKSLAAYVKTLNPLFGKLKAQMIENFADQVKRNFKSFPDDIIRRFQSVLAYGGKDLSEEELERVIVASSSAELSNKASQAFYSTVSIASDYLYEKVQDQLQDIVDELTEAAHNQAHEETKAKAAASPAAAKNSTAPIAPSKSGSSSAPPSSAPPAKPQPKIPPKAKKAAVPPKPGAKPGAKDAAEGEANIEALPKVESNLNHATKERAAPQQKRKPPTRKPRPAPPGQSGM